ncbi:hypothetical protein [Actinomadura rubteroloni]|uniref:hypothetical protein n=1 Tax=Actinomadura rubteroloni TaxID=1926885 RepID=UPI00143D0038|nr:hypothetical protein [Actinomadura rubteroloni]
MGITTEGGSDLATFASIPGGESMIMPDVFTNQRDETPSRLVTTMRSAAPG